MNSRTIIARLGFLVLAVGLAYGGLDLAGAATPDGISGQVTVQNTPANPIPVQQQGTATVTGTVKLDPLVTNTVNLGTTDSGNLASANGHLAHIDEATGNLNFDGSGRLETVGPPAAVASAFAPILLGASEGAVDSESLGGVIDASTILVVSSAEVDHLEFLYHGQLVLALSGPADQAAPGPTVWSLPLSQPIPVDHVTLYCTGPDGCDARLNIAGS